MTCVKRIVSGNCKSTRRHQRGNDCSGKDNSTIQDVNSYAGPDWMYNLLVKLILVIQMQHIGLEGNCDFVGDFHLERYRGPVVKGFP